MSTFSILKIIATCLLLVFVLQKGISQNCGVERWSIKTLSDQDTSKINFNETFISTVHEQVSLPIPQYKTKRLESETKIYSMDCFIVGYKREGSDKDIHIIIEDVETDETMVAEIPNFECYEIQKTSRLELFKDLSLWFTKNIGKPESKYVYLRKHIPVTITGIGFFDIHHGQIGMAANGRELHPVLSLKLR